MHKQCVFHLPQRHVGIIGLVFFNGPQHAFVLRNPLCFAHTGHDKLRLRNKRRNGRDIARFGKLRRGHFFHIATSGAESLHFQRQARGAHPRLGSYDGVDMHHGVGSIRRRPRFTAKHGCPLGIFPVALAGKLHRRQNERIPVVAFHHRCGHDAIVGTDFAAGRHIEFQANGTTVAPLHDIFGSGYCRKGKNKGSRKRNRTASDVISII